MEKSGSAFYKCYVFLLLFVLQLSRIPVKHRPYSDTTFGPFSLSQIAISSKSYTEEARYKKRHPPSSIAVIIESISQFSMFTAIERIKVLSDAGRMPVTEVLNT